MAPVSSSAARSSTGAYGGVDSSEKNGVIAMARAHVFGESDIAAPPETAYACIANYTEHHPRILPPAFSDFRVEQAGDRRRRG